MAPLIPIIPAMLAFAGTVVTAATRPNAPKPPARKLETSTVDQELRDASRRRARQTFAGDDSLLIGGTVGTAETVGVPSGTLLN